MFLLPGHGREFDPELTLCFRDICYASILEEQEKQQEKQRHGIKDMMQFFEV